MREAQLFDTISQVLTRAAARDALQGLVQAARDGDAHDRAQGAAWLFALTGREWLQLDDVARGPSYLPGGVAGTKGWLTPASREPSGFAAAIASMHVDGRLRERAVPLLAEHQGRLQSAALALRCLDHVPQVREAALRAVSTRTLPEDAAAIVGVLTAAAGRLTAPATLANYSTRLLAANSPATTLAALRSSADRDVRRWAFRTSLDLSLLSDDDILRTALADTDQAVRVYCRTQLGTAGTLAQLTALLEARPADGRVVALQHLADEDLTEEQLRDCLLDRSPRVREMAQWRARRLDLDLAAIYRDALSADASKAAAAVAGIASFGSADDVRLIEPFLRADSPAVRAAAVTGLAALLPAADARQILPDILLDASPRVATAVARALERAGVDADVAEPAWQSGQVWSRRAAWRLQRSSGGWQRVHADLRASNDQDLQFASTGRFGLGNWLLNGAASTWQGPTAEQKASFECLLPHSGLSREARRVVAFHAGLTAKSEPVPEAVEPPPLPEPAPSLRERVARAWGRQR